MSLDITNSIANADALVANAQAGFEASLESMPCTYCGKPIMGDELATLVSMALSEDGEVLAPGSPNAMCETCSMPPQAEPQVPTPAELAAEIARLTAENAALRKPKATPEAKPTPASPAVAAKLAKQAIAEKAARLAAQAAKTPMLPTDITPGVIDPKHLTGPEKGLLELLAKLRTKADKLKDPTNVPGTYAVAVHSWFKQRKYSEEWVRAFIANALARNVISKMFIPTRSGKDMVLLFDAQWRPNVKREFEFTPIGAADVASAHATFGKP